MSNTDNNNGKKEHKINTKTLIPVIHFFLAKLHPTILQLLLAGQQKGYLACKSSAKTIQLFWQNSYKILKTLLLVTGLIWSNSEKICQLNKNEERESVCETASYLVYAWSIIKENKCKASRSASAWICFEITFQHSSILGKIILYILWNKFKLHAMHRRTTDDDSTIQLQKSL